MAKVKCVINLPEVVLDPFVLGTNLIDGKKPVISYEGNAKIIFTRNNVITQDGLNIFITLHGIEGYELGMDVFVNDRKINNKSITPVHYPGGHYVFNYNP